MHMKPIKQATHSVPRAKKAIPLRNRLRPLPPLLVALVVCAAGFSGCVSSIPVDSTFRRTRGAKVAVVTMEAPKATILHQGPQGALDIAINHAIASGGRRELEGYPSQASVDAAGSRFAARMGSLGYKADLLKVHPLRKEFHPHSFKSGAAKPLPGRETYLKGYDAALFLDMYAVGQIQVVYAFLPLSGRKATASISGSMFAIPDERRLWRSKFVLPNKVEAKAMEGSNSSKTATVVRAIDVAVAAQSKLLEQDFFSGF